MTRILFVCLGNICRSPTADGVFRKLVSDSGYAGQILVDSAGTGDWHVGSGPDRRASTAAAERGYDLSAIRARQVTQRDFVEFDHILAMDLSNLDDLRRLSPPQHHHKIRLLLDYAPDFPEREVPDPYYGGADGFDHVLDLVEAAATELLRQIQPERPQ